MWSTTWVTWTARSIEFSSVGTPAARRSAHEVRVRTARVPGGPAQRALPAPAATRGWGRQDDLRARAQWRESTLDPEGSQEPQRIGSATGMDFASALPGVMAGIVGESGREGQSHGEPCKPGFPIWTDRRPCDGVHRAARTVGQLVNTSQPVNGSHSGNPWGRCSPLPLSVVTPTVSCKDIAAAFPSRCSFPPLHGGGPPA